MSLYISNNGLNDNTADGSIVKPFKTLDYLDRLLKIKSLAIKLSKK